VPIPEQFQPEYVSGASFDPDTLRLAARTHADHHALSGSFTLKPWVVLYLLSVWEAAVEAAEWHQKQGQHHVTDVSLWEAVTGRERRSFYAKDERTTVDIDLDEPQPVGCVELQRRKYA
jgi:hypothetical protein